VICHMMSSIDGRIVPATWGNQGLVAKFGSLYEECHRSFDSQAWMCGRITMQDFAGNHKPRFRKLAKGIQRKPFIADADARSFAVAVDPAGRLGWQKNELSGDHIIEILTEQVDDRYLDYLQQNGVSYVFGGQREINFTRALRQLSALFPIRTIMLEGGGHINGSLLNEGLIDEVSLLLAPIADGTPNTPTTFEIGEYLRIKPARTFRLAEVRQLEHDVLWIKYQRPIKA